MRVRERAFGVRGRPVVERSGRARAWCGGVLGRAWVVKRPRGARVGRARGPVHEHSFLPPLFTHLTRRHAAILRCPGWRQSVEEAICE